MGILVNHTAVDSAKLNFDSINKGIEQTNHDCEAQERGLRASFTGEGAEGWNQKIGQFIAAVAAYRGACQNLSNAIQEVAGSDGLFKTTDKNQAARFLSIDVPG